MYLARVEAAGFRSLRHTAIDLRPEVTVLVGENNGGKTNLVDAIQLLIDPLEDGRARRWWNPDDLANDYPSPVVLTGIYRDLTPAEAGTHIHALITGADGQRHGAYGVSYTPPPPERRSGDRVRSAGGRDGDPEPGARRMIRQVYLPPLRDAQQELSSGSGQSLRLILSSVLGGGSAVKEFEKLYADAIRPFETKDPIATAIERINAPLASLTEGARAQAMKLQFAEPRIEAIARALRARMNDEGVEVEDITRSGLGYANLLYIATVLTELQAAQEADLTVLLVEEPEAHLHPQLQSLLLNLLYERAGAPGPETAVGPDQPTGRIQVIITTHSPVLAAAAPVDDLVVLHAREQTTGIAQTNGGTASSTATGEDPDRQLATYRTTAAVPIAGLGLSEQELAKLTRYLDVTKSAMLFGPRVILVEGTAETLLLPPFAELTARAWIPTGDDRERARHRSTARSRFRGTPIVSVDGVDFKPFLRVLLSAFAGQRIARQVLVITDQDPTRRDRDGGETDASYNRKDDLSKYVRDELCAPERSYLIVEAKPTLEPELATADNLPVLKAVFAEMRPQSDHQWTKVAGAAEEERGVAFGKLFATYRDGGVALAKGEFAYRLSTRLTKPNTNFTVPSYLAEGLGWIMGIEAGAGDD